MGPLSKHQWVAWGHEWNPWVDTTASLDDMSGWLGQTRVGPLGRHQLVPWAHEWVPWVDTSRSLAGTPAGPLGRHNQVPWVDTSGAPLQGSPSPGSFHSSPSPGIPPLPAPPTPGPTPHPAPRLPAPLPAPMVSPRPPHHRLYRAVFIAHARQQKTPVHGKPSRVPPALPTPTQPRASQDSPPPGPWGGDRGPWEPHRSSHHIRPPPAVAWLMSPSQNNRGSTAGGQRRNGSGSH